MNDQRKDSRPAALTDAGHGNVHGNVQGPGTTPEAAEHRLTDETQHLLGSLSSRPAQDERDAGEPLLDGYDGES